MPIYGYACKRCGHTLDALQKMNDDVLVDCPECGEPALKRMLSAPRFRLKGKGWYETDFKQDNQRNLSKSDAAAESKSKPAKNEVSKSTKSSDSSGAPVKSSGKKTAEK
ncbi:MAG: zinc ribbon domain-containing protein [Gammaproteobacteria bacterium]|nr:zinc ribbon domain-containing protein [Gammaproteobacteria bacterium]